MAVATKTVTGRRELHFESIQDILADAEQLASNEVECLGNWSCGQIFDHLAKTFKATVDGVSFRAPWYIRLCAPLMKKKFLTKSMPAGFQFPERMRPDFEPADPVSTEDGLNHLREAIHRYQSAPNRAPHVVFGNMTNEEWDQLHCRHSELHLSFAVPVNQAN